MHAINIKRKREYSETLIKYVCQGEKTLLKMENVATWEEMNGSSVLTIFLQNRDTE